MATVIIVTYLAASLAVPAVWDRRHRTRRQASQTGSIRTREVGR